MKIKFNFGASDAVNFALFQFKKQKSYKRLILIALFVVFYYFINIYINNLLFTFENILFFSTPILFTLILLAIITLVVNPFLIKRKFKTFYASPDNQTLFGTIEIEFLRDEFVYTTANQTSFFKWIGIIKVHETKHYFFLYLNSTNAIIIPKEFIGVDETEIQKILQENITSYIIEK